MGEKSYFATIKCIIYDFIDKIVVSLHQLKQTDVVKRHFIIFTYTNNIRKFNLIIKIERSSDLNALFCLYRIFSYSSVCLSGWEKSLCLHSFIS